MKQYYVFYAIVGNPCTGSYYVEATNKAEAKRKVQAIDADYCRVTPMTLSQAAEEYSMDDEDIKAEAAEYAAKAVDGIYHIESGT